MNRITTLGLLLLACLAANSLFSQCIPNPNPQPGPDCGSAPFLCCGEVNNLSGGLVSTSNPSGPNPLCSNGGAPHNTEWVAFAAGSTNINMTIQLSNCNTVEQGGNTFSGVQVGIYADCAFTQEVVCLGDCQTSDFGLSAGGLNIGQVYYLFFDGCAGSICDYQIVVTSGTTEAPQPGNISGIAGLGVNGGQVCEGSTPSYSANAQFTTAYNWTVNNGATFVDNGLTMNIIDWGGPGTYTICATPSNDCHPASSLNEFCTTVTVAPNIPTVLPDGFYCENDPGYTVNILGNNYGPFTQGPQTVTIEDPTEANCDQVFNFNVFQNFNSSGFYSDFVCQGDIYFFPGNGQIYLPGTTSDIPIGPNAVGCDSTITLMLDQITTMTSILAPDTEYDCDDTVLALTANTPPGSSVSSYQWTGSNGGSIFGGDTGPSILVDGPGTYTLEVTYNFFQCTSIPVSVTITQGTTGGTTLTSSATNASCSTGTNGTATVTPDIVGSYDFLWDTNAGDQDTPTAVDLAPGIYSVTVTPAGGGCESVEMVEVMATPDVGLAVTSENDAGCLGEATGSATVLGSGGTGTLGYQWETSAGGGIDPTVSNLPADTYSVTVTDVLGCSAETMVTIGEPTTAVSIALDGIDNASCNTSDGNINVTVSGGSGGYTYSWSNTSGNEDLTNVPAGQYVLNVTDVNGCPATLTETVPSANGPSVSIAPTDVACSGETNGSLLATVTGGSAITTINWDNAPNVLNPTMLAAGVYNLTIIDDNNCETTGSATIIAPPVLEATIVATATDCDTPTGELLVNPTGGNGGYGYVWDNAPNVQNPTGLGANTYSVTVTDSEGCSVIETETIALPAPPTGSSSATNVSCNNAEDGVVTISMDGSAVGPFQYDWGNATYNGNATNGSLPPDTYTVVVTDGNGCTIDFTEVVSENAPIDALVTPLAPDCVGEFSGTASVVPSGGTGTDFTYIWCNAETTPTVNNLPAGPCTVTVYNAGCEETFNFMVPDAVAVEATLTTSTDVTCFGDDDGTIQVNGVGGSGTLEYQWGGALPDSDNLAGLEPGIYELTLEDANGCSFELAAINIIEPPLLEVDVQATATDCDVDNGTVLATASGGNGGFGYDWDNNADDIDNPGSLGANTYTVIVTDALGCTAEGQGEVTQPLSSTGVSSSDNVSCNTEDDGQVNIVMDAGGNGPYEYDWGNSLYNDNASNNNLPPATYNVIVTDDNGCTTEFTEVVTEPDAILATVTPAAPACFNELNGTALVVPSGGTGSDFTFEWCNSETTPSVDNLPSGNCSVIVYNDGCQQEFDFVIPDVDELTASVTNFADASCNAANDGVISVTAGGGTGTISYNWGGSLPDSPDLTSLEPGVYQVTIEDDNGCSEILNAVTIAQPDPMTITATTEDASCNLSNGTIHVVVTGGDGDYTYNWPNSWPDSPTLDEIVPAGTFPLTVVDGAGCDVSQMIEVLTPNILIVDDIIATEVSCFDESDAVITVTASGGNGPYDYDWGPGIVADDVLSLVPAGTYNVAITDADDCTVNSSIVIDNPAEVLITLEGTQPTDCLMPTGSIDVSATGGTGNLSFLWNGTIPTEDLSLLAPGSYSLVVTDDNSCSAELTVPISAPGLFTATETVDNSSCAGADDGSIDIQVTDGSGNFNYTWPAGSGVGNVNTAGGLEPGNYAILIEDTGTGCEYTVNTMITEPALLEVTSGNDVDATCLQNDGSITVDIVGGSGGNMYEWTGPGSYMSNDEDISNLVPGDYDLVVTDMNGCVTTTSANIGVPIDPTLSSILEDVDCADDATGSIQLSMTNPNGGGTFVWSSATIGDTDFAENLFAGTYSVTVTDDLNCTAELTGILIDEPEEIVLGYTEMQASCGQNNGSIAVTVQGGVGPYDFDWDDLADVQNPGNAGVGIHNLIVTDANECEQTLAAIVTEPSSLASSVDVVNVDCFGQSTGSIDLTITGGNPGPTGFTYAWTGTNQTVEDPVNLPEGTYSVLVTDEDGCSIPVDAIVISAGAEIILDETIVDATCGEENGSIALTATGGTSTITFDWVDPLIIDGPTATGLGVGNYEVIATDALGCIQNGTYSVLSPGTPDVAAVVEDNDCFGGTDGSITLNIITGTPPFDFDWEVDQYDGNDVVTNLPMGTYNLTVTDDLDCPFPMSLEVTEPIELAASIISAEGANCSGEANGSAIVAGQDGTAGYTYEWSNGDMDEELSNVAAGDYTVTVFDANMCEAETQVTITEPMPISLIPTSSEQVSCFGIADGTISVEASGGNEIFDYTWNDPALNGQNVLAGLSAGAYAVTVSDQFGCTEISNFDIGEPAEMDIQVAGVSDFDGFFVSCATEADGFIDLSVSGGTGNYTYDWSNGETTASLNNLEPGNYFVTITDASDCETTWDESFVGPLPITFDFDVLDARCSEDASGAVVVTETSGGSGNLIFGLNTDPVGDGIFPNLGAGDYYIIAEDDNGCLSDEFELTVAEPSPFEIILTSADDNDPTTEEIDLNYGDSTVITATHFGGADLSTLEWSQNADYDCIGDCLSIRVRPTETTTYSVTGVDENGCDTEQQIVVRVRKQRNIYIPNAFNPNSINNPTFEIGIGAGVESIESFIIVDRWGEIVWQLGEPHKAQQQPLLGWDGTLDGTQMNPGVFVYHIEVKFIDGDILPYSGDVTLIK